MSIFQAFKLAWGSIVGNKMRSFLTMLGMIIGVGSVIALVSLMQAMSNYMMKSYEDMGTNLITVNVSGSGSRSADADDMYQIALENTDLMQGVSPQVPGQYTIKRGRETLKNKSVTGVGENYDKLNRMKISSGRFLNYSDVSSRQKNCFIGTYIANELFPEGNPVGQRINIKGESYVVIGVQEEKANSEMGTEDDCIYIPYTNATKLAMNNTITTYIFSARSTDVVDPARKIIEKELYDIFRDSDLYSTFSLAMLLDMVNQQMALMTALLAGIAGISLLVAGIGIMNIMLVSVTERTREIGIRKSLGAKKKDIMRQFVMEAGATSTIGGVIGIILGGTVTTSLGNLMSKSVPGFDAAPSLGAVALAFGVSVGIGLLFGYMPANKAAKLNPIDALRNE